MVQPFSKMSLPGLTGLQLWEIGPGSMRHHFTHGLAITMSKPHREPLGSVGENFNNSSFVDKVFKMWTYCEWIRFWWKWMHTVIQSVTAVVFICCLQLELRDGTAALFDIMCNDRWQSRLNAVIVSNPENLKELRYLSIFFFVVIFTALLFLPFIVSSVFPGRPSSSPTPFSVTSLTSHLLLLPQSAPSPPFFFSPALTHESHRGCEVTGIMELWGTCMLR